MSAEGIYPLATQNGQAIPLEIVKPVSVTKWTLVAATVKAVIIPASAVTAWIYSTVDCILSFNVTALPTALVDNTIYPDATFIPANTFVNIDVTAGAAQILPLASGDAYLNVVIQWGSLNQKLQTEIG